jgi:hypothetical protein
MDTTDDDELVLFPALREQIPQPAPIAQHAPKALRPCGCGSGRIATLWATAKDNCTFLVPHLGIKREGYTPPSIGLGTGGDGAKVVFCLECGRLQGFSPVSDETILDVAKGMWEST